MSLSICPVSNLLAGRRSSSRSPISRAPRWAFLRAAYTTAAAVAVNPTATIQSTISEQMKQSQLKRLETKHKGEFKKVMELQAKIKQIKEMKAKTKKEMLHPDPLVNQAYLELQQEEEMERITAQKRARLIERGILPPNTYANGHQRNGTEITLEAATGTAKANGSHHANGTNGIHHANGANGIHHANANGTHHANGANGHAEANGKAVNGTNGANGSHTHHVQDKNGPILPATETNGNKASNPPRTFKPLSKLFDDDILAELAAPKPAATVHKSAQKPIIENPFLRKAKY